MSTRPPRDPRPRRHQRPRHRHRTGVKHHTQPPSEPPTRRSKRTARTDHVVQRGLDATRILQAIGNPSNIAAIQVVASTCVAMLGVSFLFSLLHRRTNKFECLALLERVHTIVCAIINLTSGGGGAAPYFNGGPVGGSKLPPALECGVAQFAE
ncbi:hypothetical protein B0H10DRAFT_2249744 [Mycena sp. CBHHK59/15]|nr:hypothetical protein B0H10DRAFT_2249744 [Mycena sp. CBHHK59/15]